MNCPKCGTKMNKSPSAYEKQLQMYAFMLYLTGKPITKLSIYMILRDWNKREMQKNPDYPRIPFHHLSFDVWPMEKIQEFVLGRVSLHLQAERWLNEHPNDPIPEEFWCSAEERWRKAEKFAVMKKGAKKASRVCLSMEAAGAWISYHPLVGAKYEIEKRPGEDTKCINYCNYNSFCPYYKENHESIIQEEI